jgi:hypothetical protein
MVNYLGGNYDGTVSDAPDNNGNGGLNLAQRLDDAVLPHGRNGGNEVFSPDARGVNGAHPCYGSTFIPSAGGSGRLEQQIAHTSQMISSRG